MKGIRVYLNNEVIDTWPEDHVQRLNPDRSLDIIKYRDDGIGEVAKHYEEKEWHGVAHGPVVIRSPE